MAKEKSKDSIANEWLVMAKGDLKSAKLLYKGKMYAFALYHLQQSNEKLAKGLLISFGILSVNNQNMDKRIKDLLNFTPRQPKDYHHKITPSFVSDVAKMTPSIEELFDLIDQQGIEVDRINATRNLIKGKKRELEILRKKPYNAITDEKQLENEILITKNLLSQYSAVLKRVETDIERLDFRDIVRVAHVMVGVPSTEETIKEYKKGLIKKRIMDSTNLTILTTAAVAIASFVDPLEAITRYPDSEKKFDLENCYVKHFLDITALVETTLKESIKLNTVKLKAKTIMS